jgi:hypothetical protein
MFFASAAFFGRPILAVGRLMLRQWSRRARDTRGKFAERRTTLVSAAATKKPRRLPAGVLEHLA